ncbi:MAG TPA: hypothetical protein VFM82_07620 [Flavobacteriaceae bacterium]|nr:hypothetical protein [Flavobacteriaceae bacterium]
MSKDKTLPQVGPTERLYIGAAECLQSHVPISDLSKSLSRMFWGYLQQVENYPPGEMPLVANHFFLLLAYLHTIDESFPENHTDFNGYFEECMLKYHAFQDDENEPKNPEK